MIVNNVVRRRTHRDDHTLPFNDIHMGMAYACGAPGDESRRGFLESLREYMADEARSDHRFKPARNIYI